MFIFRNYIFFYLRSRNYKVKLFFEDFRAIKYAFGFDKEFIKKVFLKL